MADMLNYREFANHLQEKAKELEAATQVLKSMPATHTVVCPKCLVMHKADSRNLCYCDYESPEIPFGERD